MGAGGFELGPRRLGSLQLWKGSGTGWLQHGGWEPGHLGSFPILALGVGQGLPSPAGAGEGEGGGMGGSSCSEKPGRSQTGDKGAFEAGDERGLL